MIRTTVSKSRDLMNTMYWLHGAEPRHYCKFCKKSLQFKFVIAYWANIGLASTRAARAALAGHVGPFAAGRRTGLAHWGRSTSLPPPPLSLSLPPSLSLCLSLTLAAPLRGCPLPLPPSTSSSVPGARLPRPPGPATSPLPRAGGACSLPSQLCRAHYLQFKL